MQGGICTCHAVAAAFCLTVAAVEAWCTAAVLSSHQTSGHKYSCAEPLSRCAQVSFSGQAVVFVVRTAKHSLTVVAGRLTYIAYFAAQVRQQG